jgi:hypothetical protein
MEPDSAGWARNSVGIIGPHCSVMQMMSALPHDELVQENGCCMIWLMLKLNPGPKDWTGMSRFLIEKMRVHPRALRVTYWCVSTLILLAQQDGKSKQEMVDAGLSERLSEIISSCRDQWLLQGCLTLVAELAHDSPMAR